MCGIVGFIGNKEKKDVVLSGLKELEYRGYDSAGMAVLNDEEIRYFKAVGKLENLANKMQDESFLGFGVAIGHTRWATHGKPTEINAHPHLGEHSFVVHNGIIENYAELKDELIKEGVHFASQTDTEVIVHLFELNLKQGLDAKSAWEATIARLRGAYATLLISKTAPGVIFFAKDAAPLAIAKDSAGEIFFASSDAALIGVAKEVLYLEDKSHGFASLGEIKNLLRKWRD